jgi:hypothetical protein
MDFTGLVKVPAIAKILEILTWFASDNWFLRREQALNGAKQAYISTGQTLTGSAVLSIPQAQQADQIFSFLLFATDENSGKGRYRIDSIDPDITAAPPHGAPIFAAGFQVLIAGHENIRGFRARAESGATLNYTYQLFQ